MNSVSTFEELVRSAKAMQPAAADIDTVVASAGRVVPRRSRLRRPGALVVAALLVIAVPSTAIAVTQLLAPDKVAQSLPAAQIWLQGTKPTCTTITDGAQYDCTLASAPTDGPTNWHGTIENTVDAAGRLNGACVAANDSGTRWTCYVGQAAADRRLVLTKQQFIDKYGPIKTGPGSAGAIYLGAKIEQAAG